MLTIFTVQEEKFPVKISSRSVARRDLIGVKELNMLQIKKNYNAFD
jgi:hypothetical protein